MSTSPRDQENYNAAYKERKFFFTGLPTKYTGMIYAALEEAMKRGLASPDMVQGLLEMLKDGVAIHGVIRDLGIDARVEDFNKYPVIIPFSKGIEKIIMDQPTTTCIYGNQASGKTVMAWNMAWRLFLKLHVKPEIHIYNDIDGITEGLNKAIQTNEIQGSESIAFSKRIQTHSTWETPPHSFDPQIIIINELSEELMSERNMGTASLEAKLMMLRQRHTQRWIFINIINATTAQKLFRDAPLIQAIKPLSPMLRQNLQDASPRSWKPFIFLNTNISKKQAVVSYSLMNYNGGTAMEYYNVDEPPWYEAAKKFAMIDPRIAYGADSMKTADVDHAIELYRTGKFTWRDIEKKMAEERGVTRKASTWNRICTAIAPDLKTLWKDLRGKKKEDVAESTSEEQNNEEEGGGEPDDDQSNR